MSEKVILIGAGAHAAEITDYIELFNDFQVESTHRINIKGYLADYPEAYDQYQFEAPLLGGIKTHNIDSACKYIIAIADIKNRKIIIENFLKQGAEFLIFIHPSAFVSKRSTIGTGCVIAPNVNIGPNVKIGNFNIINSRASIGHDSLIGDYNFITSNVCFSGFTKIGNGNLFGINSVTIPHISIGSNNEISAGMVLDKNIKDNTTVFYRFKEKLIAVKVK